MTTQGMYINQTGDEPQKQDKQASKRTPLLREEVTYQITLIGLRQRQGSLDRTDTVCESALVFSLTNLFSRTFDFSKIRVLLSSQSAPRRRRCGSWVEAHPAGSPVPPHHAHVRRHRAARHSSQHGPAPTREPILARLGESRFAVVSAPSEPADGLPERLLLPRRLYPFHLRVRPRLDFRRLLAQRPLSNLRGCTRTHPSGKSFAASAPPNPPQTPHCHCSTPISHSHPMSHSHASLSVRTLISHSYFSPPYQHPSEPLRDTLPCAFSSYMAKPSIFSLSSCFVDLSERTLSRRHAPASARLQFCQLEPRTLQI